jgi:hypothetical protein
MAKQVGSSIIKNTALGFVAAFGVAAAPLVHADSNPFQPNQAKGPSPIGLHFTMVGKDLSDLLPGGHKQVGLFIGKGQNNGGNVAGLYQAACAIGSPSGGFVPALLIATGHEKAAARINKPIELNFTSVASLTRTKDLNLGNPISPQAFATSFAKTVPLGPLTTMEMYPKQWQLNYTVDVDTPIKPASETQSHLKFVAKIDAPDVRMLNDLGQPAFH